VPVIQKTTRVRLLICTLLSSYDNSNDTRVREPNRGHSSILFREWRNQHAAHKIGVAPTFSQGDVRLGSLADISCCQLSLNGVRSDINYSPVMPTYGPHYSPDIWWLPL
jgi:hypothetical protein